MAKKKKKKPSGARKSSYAKGRKVEPEKAKAGTKRTEGTATGAKPGSGKATSKAATEKGAAAKGAPTGEKPTGGVVPWNVVRRGTREMKVFQVLLGILIVGALIQYPLWIEVANRQYKTQMKTYEKDLKKYDTANAKYKEEKKAYDQALEEFENKYKTADEQQAHGDEAPEAPTEPKKPVKPIKPSFTAFLLYQALLLVIQGAFFAFLGINVAARTDMGTPLLDRLVERKAKWADAVDVLMWSIPFGFLSLASLVISTVIGKSFGLAKVTGGSNEALWKNALNYVNVAIFNEMMFVFLLFSALVWVFMRYREKTRLEPHWTGLAVASLLAFGYFYLASRSAGEKLGLSLSSAAFLAFSLVAVLGYLYWKKGFEYSLLAGAISLGVYPFIASVFIK